MLDWWTVRGERFGVENFDFKVELTRDADTPAPSGRTCDERTLEAFEGGDWTFAVVTVTPVDRELTDLPHCAYSLGEVVWGEFPDDGRIDRDDIVASPVEERMLAPVLHRLTRAGRTVEFAPDSPLAPYCTRGEGR